MPDIRSVLKELKLHDIHTNIGDEEERQLLEATAEGSWDAFTRLYKAYSPLILHYLQVYLFERQDIEEVGQEVFLKVWKKKEGLPAVRSFKNFLFIIARNALNDFLRARQSRLQRHAGYERDFVLPRYSADDKVVNDQYEAIVHAALATLPERQRRIFELRTKEEMTIQAIASEVGMSVGGVHKSLSQATGHIKHYLSAHGLHFSILLLLAKLNNW